MLQQAENTPKDLEFAPVYASRAGEQASPTVEGLDSVLDANYAKKLGREIYESSTNWLNASRRTKWSDSLRSFQGLHPAGSKYLSKDYEYRSRLFRPKTRSMVRKAEASVVQAYFSNEDVVSLTAQDDNDKMQQASAEIMQRLLQHRLTHTIPWFLTLVGARQDAEIMGICIGKVFWKYSEKHLKTETRPRLDQNGMPTLEESGELAMDYFDISEKTEDHPWIDLVAPENFRFDPGADWRNPIATSPYTIELIPMYVCDVQARIEKGEWQPVALSALANATSLDDDITRRSREQGRIPGKAAESWKPKPFDICWVRENIIRQNGEEVHFYSLNGSGELLTLPGDLKKVYLHGMRPYVCGFVVPEAHKTYPSGKVELIRDLQTKANDIDNLRLDNVKLSLNPRQFVSAGYGLDPNDLMRFKPGKVNITNGKVNIGEVIAWDRPPEVTGSAYAEQDRVDMDFDELVGGISNATVQANKGVFDAVGNTELLSGNASEMEEYDMRVFNETFVEPVIRHLVKLEQKYETDPIVLAIAGQKAQLFQKFGINEITDQLLEQELTIKVNVGTGATNPKQQLQNLGIASDMIAKVFGPAAAMGVNAEEYIKEVFSKCGYKDGMRFFMPGFNFQQAMQMMAGGKSKGQDPQAKVTEQQAEQQRQREQDQWDLKKTQQQHEYKMQELMVQNQGKAQEISAKNNLEAWKHTQKLQAEGQRNNQMIQMSQRPAATVQFDAAAPLQNMMKEMQGGHATALSALQEILKPVAQAAIAMSEVAKTMPQQQIALTGAIEKLTKAHLAPRKGKRLPDGTLISEAVTEN